MKPENFEEVRKLMNEFDSTIDAIKDLQNAESVRIFYKSGRAKLTLVDEQTEGFFGYETRKYIDALIARYTDRIGEIRIELENL